MYNPQSKSTGSRITNEMIPMVKDKFLFLYLEYAKIVQDEFSIAAYHNNQKILIPIAMINVLLLGPGTSLSHAAIKTIADAGSSIIWCGQNIKYIYSTSLVVSEYSKNLIVQAKCFSDTKKHMNVVRRMYQSRYEDVCLDKFSLEQMRGMEGKRVKDAYEKHAEENNVEWDGRRYNDDTSANKMLMIGNSLLYGICQAAIISFGMSPGLGFIHNGDARSFVYDVADLYKEKIVIPTAFKLASKKMNEKDALEEFRLTFSNFDLLKKISKDLQTLFKFDDLTAKLPIDVGLWNISDCVASTVNYGNWR